MDHASYPFFIMDGSQREDVTQQRQNANISSNLSFFYGACSVKCMMLLRLWKSARHLGQLQHKNR